MHSTKIYLAALLLQVTCLNLSEKYKIEYVAASEGATIVLATDHSAGVSDVFILNDYQCRKLASKYVY